MRVARRLRLPGVWGALVAALLVVTPAPAWAHLALRESRPAAGDSVRAPVVLRLAFTEPVALAFSRVTLRGPGGELRLDGLALASPTELRAALPDTLPPGSYTVEWQAAGADGHPIRDSFPFELLADTAAAPIDTGTAAVGTSEHAATHHAGEPATSAAQSPLYAAVRWISFVGLLGVIGAVSFRLLVLRESREGAAEAARVGLMASGLLAITLLLRFAAQWLSVRAAGEWPSLGTFLTMLGRTTWGWGWLAQALALAVTAAGLALARRDDRAGWRVAAGGAVALAFTPALSGHAAATPGLAPLAVAADGLHVLGAGGWLGTLLLLVLVGLRAGGPRAAELVRAFSPLALGFAAVVVLTGALSTWMHLGSVADLWRSAYGRTLLLKLTVLAAVFALGGYNWRRVRPALGSDGAAAHLRRSATTELALGAVVLAVTAVLVATAQP